MELLFNVADKVFCRVVFVLKIHKSTRNMVLISVVKDEHAVEQTEEPQVMISYDE